MKAIINGIECEGTASEFAELLRVLEKQRIMDEFNDAKGYNNEPQPYKVTLLENSHGTAHEIEGPQWIKREMWDDCVNQDDFVVIDENLARGRVKINAR